MKFWIHRNSSRIGIRSSENTVCHFREVTSRQKPAEQIDEPIRQSDGGPGASAPDGWTREKAALDPWHSTALPSFHLTTEAWRWAVTGSNLHGGLLKEEMEWFDKGYRREIFFDFAFDSVLNPVSSKIMEKKCSNNCSYW